VCLRDFQYVAIQYVSDAYLLETTPQRKLTIRAVQVELILLLEYFVDYLTEYSSTCLIPKVAVNYRVAQNKRTRTQFLIQISIVFNKKIMSEILVKFWSSGAAICDYIHP